MKKIFFLLTFFSFSLFALHYSLYGQDDGVKKNSWENYMTPGENHKWMAMSAGKWYGDVNTYMDPGGTPMTSTAKVRYTMIYNGLYQLGVYKGNIMGQPFEGQGILAYDNSRQQFITTWIDNMGSGVMLMTGQFDAAAKTLHLKGTQADPKTKKELTVRQDILFVDDNTQVVTMYGPDVDGKEVKLVDIRLTRMNKKRMHKH